MIDAQKCKFNEWFAIRILINFSEYRFVVTHTNLDMDVLRTFVTGFELGSFARAAQRLGRSQSAISNQIRKLEGQIGLPLVQKSGRGLALTAAGESLFSYAKRILELNDETVDTVRGSNLDGWVRLGLPQDFSDFFLPTVLGRFSRVHPKVRAEVHVDRSVALIEQTIKGELDMSLVWGDGGSAPYAERIADLPVSWIAHPNWVRAHTLGSDPLPLVAFEPPCSFRAAGIAALDECHIPWRLVFTSPSLSGLWAAVEAGLGITLRTTFSMPRTLVALEPGAMGLPVLPAIPLALHRAEGEARPVVCRLTDIVLETIREEIRLSHAR